MGYDISQEKHEKLCRNRAEGRLCGGATMVRGGCSIRATVKELHLSWNTEADKLAGVEPTESEMTLCKRHTYPVGFEGANFRVTGHRNF